MHSSLNILFAFFLIFFVGCTAQSKNESVAGVKEIIYSFSAGRAGKVTINARTESLNVVSFGALSQKYPSQKKKLENKDWRYLLAQIPIEKLKHIKSGEIRSVYDGADDVITIINDKNDSVTIINASTNELRPLQKQLKTMVSNQ